ncbi:Glutamate N-acetyltransferase / Amino-acid acetyltransferase [Gammaproteobacteria bacterium]
MSTSELAFLPVPGFRLATAAAGIRYRHRDDLVVMAMPEGVTTAAVFTRNAFCAAPVVLAREHLRTTAPRYLLINAGNANAGTGERGLSDARATCALMARLTGCEATQVLPFSTGVIGEYLPLAPFEAVLPRVLSALSERAWPAAARAIMTTDTVPKLVSQTFEMGAQRANLTGIAKGAGMIRPDMATMLAFLATDATVAPALLQECLERAVAPSFNAITIDGDTSTNDACVLVATGRLGPAIEHATDPGYAALENRVQTVCKALARAIVQDGEGATKLVTIRVRDAASVDEALQVAYTIAHSPLVKTALFASDPNWGRILAAIGRAGLSALAIDRIEIWLDQVCIVRGGGRAADYTEAAGREVLAKPEFTIGVRLGRGKAETEILTCDLSVDYVRINADYRT